VDSPHFGVTFEITEVAGRTHVLFHKGNTVEDTHGCVLIGEEFAGASVASSKRGFDEFMALMNGREEFWLVVLRDEGG
jgi:predicted secreted hydrolase